MQFRLLGALEVALDDDLLRIASALQRRLLAVLLVQAGSVVSADQLVDVLWGEKPPVDARQSLWTNVARLRRALSGSGGGPGPLLTRSPGYLLDVDPEQVDAGQFEAWAAAASRLTAQQPREAGDLLDRALALWRGPALQEFAEEPFAATEAARLEELRLAVTEGRFDIDLRVGDEHELAARLSAYTQRHPFREQPRAQLMLALYRCGRQAEALEAYRSYQELLDRELGVEPSQPLRDRQTEILRQAPSLDRDLPAVEVRSDGSSTAQPTRPPPSSASVLPPQLTSFVGREEDLAEAVAALRDSRLVTLTGVGGVGKTRLAMRAAAAVSGHFTDGLSWCELAPVTEPSAVSAAVATALGVRRSAESSVVESVVDFLSLRQMLLVLDNCEHLLNGIRPLVESLLRGCPGLVVLATSRVRLAVAGEHVRPVAPLPVPPPSDRPDPTTAAVALFVQRARAGRPELQLDQDNLAKIVDICRELDGLPLALELAAARIRSLNPTDLLDRMPTRLDLRSPVDHQAGRHATLRTVVDWSYELLSPVQRRLFDRLSVFAGGFDLTAVEAVCCGGGVERDDIVDLLTALVDASMVTVGSTADRVRYSLLETLRQYGAQHLDRREADAVRSAHASHYAAFAERADQGLRGPDEARWVSIVDAELDNCRAAHQAVVETARPDVALQLSRGLRYYMLFRYRDEVVSWGESSLDLPGATEHPLFAEVCGAVGEGVTVRGEMARATDLAERGLSLLDDPDDPRRIFGLRAAGMVSLYVGRLDDALHQHAEMLRLARVHDHAYEAGMALLGLAQSRTYAGDPRQGLEYAEEQYRAVRTLGNPSMLSLAWYDQAEALAGLRPDQAIEPYRRAVELAASAGSTFVEGIALVGLASLLGRSGEPSVALPLFRSIIDRWRRMGVWHHQWTTLRNLVQLFLRIESWESSAVLVGAITASGTATPAFGADAALMQAAVDRLEDVLGSSGWAAARGRGAAMAADETVKFAGQAIDRECALLRPPGQVGVVVGGT
jgi:predicted ATPase/DNA-binding SARP family transcriptional activator